MIRRTRTRRPGSPCRPAAWALLALAAAAASAQPAPPPGPARANGVGLVAHCSGGPPLVFTDSDVRADLDDDDSRAVAAGIVERYPVIAQHEGPPDRMLLAQRAGRWLYATLRERSAADGGPCFTATFSADRFGFTAELLRKYFGTTT